jgi:hypothetical protein
VSTPGQHQAVVGDHQPVEARHTGHQPGRDDARGHQCEFRHGGQASISAKKADEGVGEECAPRERDEPGPPTRTVEGEVGAAQIALTRVEPPADGANECLHVGALQATPAGVVATTGERRPECVDRRWRDHGYGDEDGFASIAMSTMVLPGHQHNEWCSDESKQPDESAEHEHRTGIASVAEPGQSNDEPQHHGAEKWFGKRTLGDHPRRGQHDHR